MADKTGYSETPEIINTNLARDAHLSVNVNPNAFGVGVANAMEGLGKTGLDVAIKKQELANNLTHDQIALDMSNQFSDAWKDYGKLEGDAAVKGLHDFQQRLKDIYNSSVQNAPNDAVREKLAQTMFRDADRYMSHGANYADTQFRHWQNKVHDDGVRHVADQVMLNRNQSNKDLEFLINNGVGGVGGTNSIRQRELDKFGPGTDVNSPEVKNAIEGEVSKAYSQNILPVVEALANEGKIREAEDKFNYFKHLMDNKGVAAGEAFLRPRLKEQNAEDVANKFRPIPDASGFSPTITAKAYKDGLVSVPSRANAQALGIASQPPQSQAPIRYNGAHLPADAELAIDRAAKATGVDANLMKTFARIESSGRKGEVTGSYNGLFQLSNEEFKLHGHGDIFNANDNAMAAANKIKSDSASFKLSTGRDATPFDLYMVHQQGIAGAPAHFNNPDGVAWKNIKPFYSDYEAHKHHFPNGEAMAKAAVWGNIPTDQRMRFPNGVEGVTSGQFLDMWRGKFARLSGQPQPQPAQPQAKEQPESILTGSETRRQRKMSNLELAQRESHGDPELRDAIYNKLNRRDILIQDSVGARHQYIDMAMKNLTEAAKNGVANLSLDSVHLNEQMIREAYPANQQYKAEHMIESFKMMEQTANDLHGLEYASKEDIDNYVAKAFNGEGIKTMIEGHRKKNGTESMFSLGADPDAAGEDIAHHYDIHQQTAALVKNWYTRRQEEIAKDPVAWISRSPDVAQKLQAYQAAEQYGNASTKADAYRELVTISVEKQERMGIAPKDMHILSVKAATAQTNFIMNHRDPKEAMEIIKAQHPEQWGRIFNDLVKIGGLPPKFEALQELDAQNSAILSGRIKAEAAEKGAEHKREQTDLLGKNVGVIHNHIVENETVRQYLASLGKRGVSDPLKAEVVSTMNMLAQGRTIDLKEDPKVAADEAIKAFTKNYKFTKDDVMIPAAKHDAVMAEAHDKISWLQTMNIMTPPQAGMDQSAYIASVKANGSWKSTPDGDGMYLTDHWGRPVISDGKLIQVMYDRPELSISSRQSMRPASFKGIPLRER